MAWIVRNMKWVMLVSGMLTATMLYAVVAPEEALRSTFGETLTGPIANIVTRNWGALITLVGGMLIYGAFRPETRPLVLTIAGGSKAVFIGLVLSQGTQYLRHGAGVAIVVDSLMVVLFAWYLLSARPAKR